MNDPFAEEVEKMVQQALSGRGAHVLNKDGLDGLDWKLAGQASEGMPHSIFQIVGHLVYWQDFTLRWIDGSKPPTPEHADESWPGAPAPVSEEEWLALRDRFLEGLGTLEIRAVEMDLATERGPKTVLEMLQLIASHNSYHMGQIALIRRALGAWPPPEGGATW